MIGVELAWRAGRQVHHGKRGGEKACVRVCVSEDVAQSSHLLRVKGGLLAELASVIGELGMASSETWLAVATW